MKIHVYFDESFGDRKWTIKACSDDGRAFFEDCGNTRRAARRRAINMMRRGEQALLDEIAEREHRRDFWITEGDIK